MRMRPDCASLSPFPETGIGPWSKVWRRRSVNGSRTDGATYEKVLPPPARPVAETDRRVGPIPGAPVGIKVRGVGVPGVPVRVIGKTRPPEVAGAWPPAVARAPRPPRAKATPTIVVPAPAADRAEFR